MALIPGLVSVFTLTIDRFDMSMKTLTTSFNNAEGAYPMEWLVCDNGSKDRRIVEWVAKHPLLKYHRVNSRNEGVGRAFNQLYLRSQGEYLCFIGGDLELPKGWLKEMMGYVMGVPNSGMIGMSWGHGGVPPLTMQYGSWGHWLTPTLNRIFGVWIMRRAVVDAIGLFPEYYDVYGLEDSNFNERVNRSGFKSLYVPSQNFMCKHLAPDVGENSEYRAMKDRSMGHNLALFHEDVRKWDQGLSLIEPLPPMRDPL